jgi:hypothetical protein
MGKKISLTIPEPCHEGWDQMSPTANGRFCASCSKEVIDFSSMSDAQLATFFKKPAGSMCGRFRENQLETPIALPKKHLPWLRYFFGITLPAFLFSQRGDAQGRVKVAPDSLQMQVPQRVILGGLGPGIVVKKPVTGRVLDDAGNPVAFASIMEKGTKNGVSADANGRFSIALLSDTATMIAVSSVGYDSQERAVLPWGNDSEKITLSRSLQGMLGAVVYVRSSKRKPVPIMTRVSDTLFAAFKIYPNPVQGGTSLNVEWKKKEKGDYDVTLVSLTGQVVMRSAASPATKKELLRFDVPVVTPGTYILRFANKATNRVYTQQVIVR